MADKVAGRLNELDSLRGIAALAVVLFHYLTRYPELSPVAEPFNPTFPWGRYGVEIFFGISGFVIIMTLQHTRGASDFIVSRFARLFPAYWAGILLTTAVIHLLGAHYLWISNEALMVNFAMAQGHLGYGAVDGAYWSLSIELGFYAVMLVLWRLNFLSRIEWPLAAWIGLKMLWAWYPSLSWGLGHLLIVEYIPFFAIGVVAYRVWCGQRSWIQQLPVMMLAYLAVILADPLPMTFVFAVSAACFVAISKNWLSFLQHRTLLWLGSISYTLYLIHQNAGFAVMDSLHSIGVTGFSAVVITLVLALSAAWLISHYIERPALSKIRNLWRHRQERVNLQRAEPEFQ